MNLNRGKEKIRDEGIIKMDEEVKVLKDLTVIKTDGDFRLKNWVVDGVTVKEHIQKAKRKK